MNFRTFALSVLLVPMLLSSSAPAAISPAAMGAVRYEVRYQSNGINMKVADATISLENGNWKGQPVLHAHASIQAVSLFRLFMNAEYLADSYLTKGRIEPLYYMNPIRKGGKEGKFECIYDGASKTVSMLFARPSAEPVQQTFPLDGRTMDLLSLLQFVRFLDSKEGSTLSMHVLKAGESVPAVLTAQGRDPERFPGVEADRFLLKMSGKGLMENGSGDRILVWRSRGNDRQLMGLEVNLGSGVMSVSVKSP